MIDKRALAKHPPTLGRKKMDTCICQTHFQCTLTCTTLFDRSPLWLIEDFQLFSEAHHAKPTRGAMACPRGPPNVAGDAVLFLLAILCDTGPLSTADLVVCPRAWSRLPLFQFRNKRVCTSHKRRGVAQNMSLQHRNSFKIRAGQSQAGNQN